MSTGTGRGPWGWPVMPRRALAGLAMLLAAGLGLGLAPRPGAGGPTPEPAMAVDPNSAPPPVLLALPRLGPALAGRIVDERRRRPFGSLDDLDARVHGVGPATVAAIRAFVRHGPTARPLSPASRARPDAP